jgi:prevent-host-death family protein
MNVHEAKTHFSKILEEVERGAEVVIARAGTPIAKIVPIGAEVPPRTLGQLRGELTVAEDFDAPLPWEEWLHDPGSSEADGGP